MNTKQIENLNSAPKKQFASSLFHQLIGSLPVAVLLAIGLTKVLTLVLPAMAETFAPQIWAALLTGGTVSTVAGALNFSARSNKLTDAKIENLKAAAVQCVPTSSDVPILATRDDADGHDDDGTPSE